MVAICQPSVSALAAAAIMCEDNHPSRPATLTLMAGPDRHKDSADQGQRIRQEQADQLVRGQSDQLRAVFSGKGAFRKVYPGFVQLTAFVSMNLERHIKQHMGPA